MEEVAKEYIKEAFGYLDPYSQIAVLVVVAIVLGAYYIKTQKGTDTKDLSATYYDNFIKINTLYEQERKKRIALTIKLDETCAENRRLKEDLNLMGARIEKMEKELIRFKEMMEIINVQL